MRDFRLQSLVNWTRLKLSRQSAYWRPWLDQYLYYWLKPVLPKKFHAKCRIFSIKDISYFRHHLLTLGRFNPIWFQRIFEPETKGVRSWEYGYLLQILKDVDIKNLTVLDAGSGNSLLPDYLASLGAKVTSLDLNKPLEPRTYKKSQVKYVVGDMTKMSFSNKSFDLVISISAIEHVGNLTNTKKALNELIRVTKLTGFLYLTTDVYLPTQTTDNWPQSPVGTIKDAYSQKDFIDIFGQYINWPQFKHLLTKDISYSNYRGRFFTTVALVIPTKTPEKFGGQKIN